MGSSAIVKVCQQRSVGKVMASIFLDTQELILADILASGATITGLYFSEVMDRLNLAVRYKRPGKLIRHP